jgi:hypothetical protein
MLSVKIPESSYPVLDALVHLAPEQFESLLAAMERAKPAARPDLFWIHVPNVEDATVRDIVRELFALASFKDELDVPIDEFVDSIASAAVADKTSKVAFTDSEASTLKQRLQKLLQLGGAVRLTSKAVDLLTDTQRVFYTSKILTDIRPVFSEDGNAADAAIIVHNLRIHYGESDEHKDFFVALDDDDLNQLRAVLDRAAHKAKVLKPLMKKAELPHLDLEE